jgi:hypothetical protein
MSSSRSARPTMFFPSAALSGWPHASSSRITRSAASDRWGRPFGGDLHRTGLQPLGTDDDPRLGLGVPPLAQERPAELAQNVAAGERVGVFGSALLLPQLERPFNQMSGAGAHPAARTPAAAGCPPSL